MNKLFVFHWSFFRLEIITFRVKVQNLLLGFLISNLTVVHTCILNKSELMLVLNHNSRSTTIYSRTCLCRTLFIRILRLSRSCRPVPIYFPIILYYFNTVNSNILESNTLVVSNTFYSPKIGKLY